MANDHVACPGWEIGTHGITQTHVKIIGAVLNKRVYPIPEKVYSIL